MTSITRKPMELHRGDTITRHPDHPEQRGEWVVKYRTYAHACLVDIYYETPDGGSGVFAVDPVVDLTVRPEPRMAMVHGLRQFATFLETHPDVPVQNWPVVHHFVDTATPAGERRAEVERIAKAMGVEAATKPGSRSHYAAVKWFGPIEFLAVSCDPDAPATAEGDAR